MRLALFQPGGFGFEGDNTIAIAGGSGSNYDNRAKTVTPIPAEQATQQQEQAAAQNKAAQDQAEAQKQQQLATYQRANAACLGGRGYVLK